MNEFEKYFRKNNKRVMTKWSNYFEIYDRHFHSLKKRKLHFWKSEWAMEVAYRCGNHILVKGHK